MAEYGQGVKMGQRRIKDNPLAQAAVSDLDAGMKPGDVCLKYGISRSKLSKWSLALRGKQIRSERNWHRACLTCPMIDLCFRSVQAGGAFVSDSCNAAAPHLAFAFVSDPQSERQRIRNLRAEHGW